MKALKKLIQLLFRGWYDQNQVIKMKRFYGQFIEAGDLCFDVGANLGSRSRVFNELGAKTVAFEPQESCQAALGAIAQEYPSFRIEQIGLGAKSGKATMKLSNQNQVSSFSDSFVRAYQGQPGISWEEEIEVEMSTLDQMIEQYGMPVFCKIDVEGYENYVLGGLSKKIPALSFEYNRRTASIAEECIALLAALGNYKFRFSAYESMKFIDSTWRNNEEMQGMLKSLDPKILTGDIYAVLVE